MAGTNNFLEWNPTEANQDDDATYAADSARTGGAGTGSNFESKTANKLFRQTSVFVAAFAQMMAAKNYNMSDTDQNVLAGILANVITGADQRTPITTLGFSPTPTFNAAAFSGFQMPLNGNVTSSTITGATAGQLLAFYFVQDGVGGRTVVWPASFAGAAQPDPAASSTSVQLFRVDNAGVVRAASPMISDNSGALFVAGRLHGASLTVPGDVTAGSVTLTAGAPSGKFLVGDGTSFVPSDISALAGSVFIPSVSFGAGNEDSNFQFALATGAGAVLAWTIDANPGATQMVMCWIDGTNLNVRLYNGRGGGGGGAITTNPFNVWYKVL